MPVPRAQLLDFRQQRGTASGVEFFFSAAPTPQSIFNIIFIAFKINSKWTSSHGNQGPSIAPVSLAEGKVRSRESLQHFWWGSAEISPLFMISLYLPKLVHIKP